MGLWDREPAVTCPSIDVHPVGLVADLLTVRVAVRAGHRWHACGGLWLMARHVGRLIRRRRWRTVGAYFHGFHAHHQRLGRRCGRGWTRRRAVRDLVGHLAEVTRRA